MRICPPLTFNKRSALGCAISPSAITSTLLNTSCSQNCLDSGHREVRFSQQLLQHVHVRIFKFSTCVRVRWRRSAAGTSLGVLSNLATVKFCAFFIPSGVTGGSVCASRGSGGSPAFFWWKSLLVRSSLASSQAT